MVGPACNLLVTYDTQHAEFARRAAEAVLAELGAGARFLEGSPPGLLEVHVQGDPRALVRRTAELCMRDPARFRHTHHWRPVDAWVRSDLPEMVRAVQQIAHRIRASDAWRATVQVHGPSRWHQRDLLKPLTDPVKGGSVQMEGFAKELRVDVVGDRAGFAVLERGDDLSVDEVRDATSRMPQEV